jgi:hypothetical protein
LDKLRFRTSVKKQHYDEEEDKSLVNYESKKWYLDAKQTEHDPDTKSYYNPDINPENDLHKRYFSFQHQASTVQESQLILQTKMLSPETQSLGLDKTTVYNQVCFIC